jgi:pimeloyl-ACP methyl ester carboxylesterase
MSPGVRFQPFHFVRDACLVGLAFVLAISGCSQTMRDRPERTTRGYIYYFDGAGGGGVVMNWAGGVRKGMLDAGYNGAGEVVKWNTGLGVIADQDSSVEYKKSKASQCAQSIQQYAKEQPGAPITLMGLSAGTAVAVFTLEALPVDGPVDNVVLLGASIAADYDLTRALQRVRNRMYVFTSENDAVLAFLVPMAGTADRQEGVSSAGLRGFQLPAGVSAETRVQYAKVAYVRWKPEFERDGDFGGHADTVKAPFVQQYIAPLVMASLARRAQPQVAGAGGKVRNPDYDRWATLPSGSWVTFEGYQLVNGVKQPLRLTARLISKHDDRLVVERTYVPLEGGQAEPSRVQHFFVEAEINPAEHPLTSPSAKITGMPAETLTIAGKRLNCRVKTVQAEGEFPEYGRGVSVTLWQNEALPGGTARVWLKSSKGNQPFEFRGEVVEYGIQ